MIKVQFLEAWSFDRFYAQGSTAVLNDSQMDALKQTRVAFQILEENPVFTPREAAVSAPKVSTKNVTHTNSEQE